MIGAIWICKVQSRVLQPVYSRHWNKTQPQLDDRQLLKHLQTSVRFASEVLDTPDEAVNPRFDTEWGRMITMKCVGWIVLILPGNDKMPAEAMCIDAGQILLSQLQIYSNCSFEESRMRIRRFVAEHVILGMLKHPTSFPLIDSVSSPPEIRINSEEILIYKNNNSAYVLGEVSMEMNYTEDSELTIPLHFKEALSDFVVAPGVSCTPLFALTDSKNLTVNLKHFGVIPLCKYLLRCSSSYNSRLVKASLTMQLKESAKMVDLELSLTFPVPETIKSCSVYFPMKSGIERLENVHACPLSSVPKVQNDAISYKIDILDQHRYSFSCHVKIRNVEFLGDEEAAIIDLQLKPCSLPYVSIDVDQYNVSRLASKSPQIVVSSNVIHRFEIEKIPVRLD